MAPEIKVSRLSDFSGGLNKDKDPALLEINESPESLNCEFTRNGAVRKRKGVTKWSINENLGMSMIDYLFHWNQLVPANTWFIAVDNDGDVYHSNTNDFSGAAVADYGAAAAAREEFKAGAALNDAFYMSSLDTTVLPLKFDGTNWTQFADTTPNGSGNEFPIVRFLLSKHERMFGFSSPGLHSRIWFSDPGQPETWQANSWIDVDPDDGSEIQGVASFGDGILIFKDRSIYLLSGTDENSFTLYPVDTSVGTMCPKTVVSGANKVFWLDPFQGVYVFDGANVTPISDPIREYLLANINNNSPYIARHSAFFYKDKYYLSVCWNGSVDTTTPTRTFVYDTRLKAWTEWSVGFASAVVVDGVAYIGRPRGDHIGGSATVGVYKLEDGETDAGAAFTSRFKTPWFSPSGSVNLKHRVRHFTLFLTSQQAGSTQFTLARDFDPSDVVSQQTLSSVPPASEDEVVVNMPSVSRSLSNALQLTVEEVGSDPWQLNGIELTYNVRADMRGDRSA